MEMAPYVGWPMHSLYLINGNVETFRSGLIIWVDYDLGDRKVQLKVLLHVKLLPML
jgi:hypothetical protein